MALTARARALAITAFLAGGALVVHFVRAAPERGSPARESAEGVDGAPRPSAERARSTLERTSVPGARTPAARVAGRMLPFGSGAEAFGRPRDEEGHGPVLNLATDPSGRLTLLDPANRRLLRFDAAGRPLGATRLPGEAADDVGAAADGTLAVLDVHGAGQVSLLAPDGSALGALPLAGPGLAPESVRGVHVAGEDVYAESYNGEYRRLGDVSGRVDAQRPEVPGQPMRDGRGFLTALLTDASTGAVHVYVLERSTGLQRFSRLLQLGVEVEGLFLVDTSSDGTIYLGVHAVPPGAAPGTRTAQLLCLEPEHGQVTGRADLPVGADGTIVDGSALDAGGIAYAVWTQDGVRLERHDCR